MPSSLNFHNPFCLSDGLSDLIIFVLDHLSQFLGCRYSHLQLHLAASNSKFMNKASLTIPHKDRLTLLCLIITSNSVLVKAFNTTEIGVAINFLLFVYCPLFIRAEAFTPSSACWRPSRNTVNKCCLVECLI